MHISKASEYTLLCFFCHLWCISNHINNYVNKNHYEKSRFIQQSIDQWIYTFYI
jgi:hypothetical protein